jgi:hypothetical protein
VTGMNTVRPARLNARLGSGNAHDCGHSRWQMGYRYNSAMDAVTHIVRDEGFRGLYKGLWPNLLKVRAFGDSIGFPVAGCLINCERSVLRWHRLLGRRLSLMSLSRACC